MKKILINLALFQVGWLVCVLGGDLYAVAFTIAALLVHNWLVLSSHSEWKLIGIVVLIGCLWDMLMAQAGVIHYADALLFGIPLWLLCLWLLFATTFMHGLFWMHRYLWLAALFAAVMGPAMGRVMNTEKSPPEISRDWRILGSAMGPSTIANTAGASG